jgi:hypothetical protein
MTNINITSKKTVLIIIILVIVGGWQFNGWRNAKLTQVELGLAEPSFPYRSYTEDELGKMYPQIKYADVQTRVTPEETYAKFRQALKDNDLEMAIEQLGKESAKYDENVKTIAEAYQQEEFEEAFDSYPEKINKESMYESIAQYEYDAEENGKVFVNSIDFIKNSSGDWKLDSL